MGLTKYKGWQPDEPWAAENANSIDPENVVLEKFAGSLIGADIVSFDVDEILVVAGGGGAGCGSNAGTYYKGGAGGAGGLIYKNNGFLIGKKSISVVVGAGGAGASGGSGGGGSNGGDSSFDTLVAKGGGGGGGVYAQGGAGGSGGGAGTGSSAGYINGGVANQPTQSGDSGTYGFGNNGGQSYSGLPGSGGGANAGGSRAGSFGQTVAGGAGKTVFGVTYAKGGDIGGAANGAVNTGNGGGTDNAASSSSYGGSGGSGIVIIKYLTSKAAGLTVSGGTITTDGLYTIHTFTASGTFSVQGTNIGNFVDLGDGANNGKIKINVDGTEYDNVSVDLSAVNSLADVAAAVQSAIRTATGGNETCVFDTDHFIITSATLGVGSQILKLMTPSTGTDLSGEDYLNCGANATEILGDDDAFRLVRLDENCLLPEGITPNVSGRNIDTGAKSFGTVYQNTSSKTKLVVVSVRCQSASGLGGTGAWAYIGATSSPNTLVSSYTYGDSGYSFQLTIPLTLIVPPGYYYKVTVGNSYNGSPALTSWFECDLF